MHSFYHPERRKTRRVKIDLPAICRLKMPLYWVRLFDEPAFEIFTVDISEGGISVISDECVPLRARLSLEFILSDLGMNDRARAASHLDFSGRVAYTSFLKDRNQYRMGISFDAGAEKDGEKFFELVCAPPLGPYGHRLNPHYGPGQTPVPCLDRLMRFFHDLLAKEL